MYILSFVIGHFQDCDIWVPNISPEKTAKLTKFLS